MLLTLQHCYRTPLSVISVITLTVPFQGKLACANAMFASVVASELFRLSENATPTLENRRSTVAEVAGQPRY